MELRAALDVGSGATKLLVARVLVTTATPTLPATTNLVEQLYSLQLDCLLSRDLEARAVADDTNNKAPSLSEEVIDELRSILTRFRDVALQYGVANKRIAGGGTAVFRKLGAAGVALLASLSSELGIRLSVLPQPLEAKLGFNAGVVLSNAAATSLSAAAETATAAARADASGSSTNTGGLVVWDSGGGSFQMTMRAPLSQPTSPSASLSLSSSISSSHSSSTSTSSSSLSSSDFVDYGVPLGSGVVTAMLLRLQRHKRDGATTTETEKMTEATTTTTDTVVDEPSPPPSSTTPSSLSTPTVNPVTADDVTALRAAIDGVIDDRDACDTVPTHLSALLSSTSSPSSSLLSSSSSTRSSPSNSSSVRVVGIGGRTCAFRMCWRLCGRAANGAFTVDDLDNAIRKCLNNTDDEIAAAGDCDYRVNTSDDNDDNECDNLVATDGSKSDDVVGASAGLIDDAGEAMPQPEMLVPKLVLIHRVCVRLGINTVYYCESNGSTAGIICHAPFFEA
jgi:hypothetical protein